MKNKLLMLAVAGLALSACTSAPVDRSKPFPKPPTATDASVKSRPAPNAPVLLRSDQISALEAAVKANLKDPYSAVITGVVAYQTVGTRALHVCGFVNAKNSFGGYTGNQSFYVLAQYKDGNFLNRAPFVSIGNDLPTQLFVKDHCLR